MNPSDELKANREEIKRAMLGTGEYTGVAQEKIDLVLAELRSDKDKWFELVKEQIRKSIFHFR